MNTYMKILCLLLAGLFFCGCAMPGVEIGPYSSVSYVGADGSEHWEEEYNHNYYHELDEDMSYSHPAGDPWGAVIPPNQR